MLDIVKKAKSAFSIIYVKTLLHLQFCKYFVNYVMYYIFLNTVWKCNAELARLIRNDNERKTHIGTIYRLEQEKSVCPTAPRFKLMFNIVEHPDENGAGKLWNRGFQVLNWVSSCVVFAEHVSSRVFQVSFYKNSSKNVQ